MNFKTVYKEAEAVDIVNKSRFIGYIKPIKSVEEAQSFIEKIRKKHYDASHNVPVYVFGDNFQVQKASDDGEPSGTAGVPILNILKNEGITNVVIVVTRYFGGVKLGTGGLVRAYSLSAKSALSAAKVISMDAYHQLNITMNYTLHGKFQNYLMQNPQYFLIESNYTDQVETAVYVSSEDVETFKGYMINMTNDQCTIQDKAEVMLPVSEGTWIK